MRHVHTAIRRPRLVALALLLLGGCARPQATPVLSRSGGQSLDLKQAQAQVDFVIYTPAYLPAGARVDEALVVPEQMVGPYLLPNEVMLALGAGLSAWEMPDGALPRPWGVPVRLDSHRVGWLSAAAGQGRVTLEWWESAGGTRIGLSGGVDPGVLIRMAKSFEPAHPEAAPRPVSARRARLAPGLATPLPAGGIGASLAPGPPPVIGAVYPRLPADRAGIKPGDQVIAVDGHPAADGPLGNSVRPVRGPVGSRVALTVRSPGQTKTRTVTLTRAALPVLHRTPMTLRQARNAVAYPVLGPSYLPPGFRLGELVVETWKPNPAALQPEVRISYDGPSRAAITISQRPASATWPPRVLPPASLPVMVGTQPAMIGAWPSDGVVLQWTAGATAVRLAAMGVGAEQALRVARSMGTPK